MTETITARDLTPDHIGRAIEVRGGDQIIAGTLEGYRRPAKGQSPQTSVRVGQGSDHVSVHLGADTEITIGTQLRPGDTFNDWYPPAEQ